jgi:hypothetical protein
VSVWHPPTEQEFNDNWLSRLEIFDEVDWRFVDDAEKWAVVEKLKAGQVIAVARTAQTDPRVSKLHPFARVPHTAWLRMDSFAQNRFWQTGHLVVPVDPNSAWSNMPKEGDQRFFDIRFDPDSLSGKPPPKFDDDRAPQEEKVRTTKLRGAKRKDWWDLLWIEMFRRIRAGTLQPKDKAELQRILEDYVDEIVGNYGDSTLKPTASNLFEYLEEIRGK